jgi:hypothetical protein
LPEEINDNASAIVRDRLSEIKSGIRDLLDGSSKKFHSEWSQVCNQFQRALEQMKPQCVCSHDSDKTVDLTETSDDEGYVYHDTPNKNTKRPGTGGGDRPNKIIIVDDSAIPYKQEQSPRTPSRSQADTNPWMQYLTCDSDALGPFYKSYLQAGHNFMSIGGLQDEIAKERRAGLPDSSTDKVKEQYALLSVAPWNRPLKTLIDVTFKLLHEKLHEHLKLVLATYEDTELYQTSEQVINDFLAEHQQILQERTALIYEVESSALFTINTPAFKLYRHKATESLKKDRLAARVNAYSSTHGPNFPKGAKGEERARIRAEWLCKVPAELKLDYRFASELSVAAYIRAYYAVSRFRFSDSICSTINAHLRHQMYKKLKYEIETRLKLDNSEGWSALTFSHILILIDCFSRNCSKMLGGAFW